MTRRTSNVVKRAKRIAAKHGTTLDRNGIPVFDPPGVNRLPRSAPTIEEAHNPMIERYVKATEDVE